MGYGYGPPGPGYFAGYPPRKAPPKKLWYGVGAALLIVGLLLTAFGAVSMIGHFADAAPDAEHTFANGEMTTVHFDAGETKVIFVANPGEHHKVRCNVGTQTGSDDEATIDNYDGGLTINQWQAVFTATAQQSSDYAVTCEGAPSDKFAVGGDVKAGSLVGSVVGLSGGGLLCLVGIVTLIVTAILRHRRAV
ncbi:hypothetical protein VST63_08810 [Mycolicibacterium sp. 050232]|uniref:hypothetical protein n=1 Tax=Mycolicibacterium sp. 050232 TaxID=3113982 RepID=UPI002E29F882|nr:hypothetical protein [Mycolicibacterium sp. 050232]MED5812461.1 hypothetical protein [Mycolicibacterium sp. 050232]